MKKLIALTLTLNFSGPLWAIDEILQGLDAINRSALDCSQMGQKELALECAHQVCGSPQKRSVKISARDANDYLSPEDLRKLNALAGQIKSFYENKENEINSLVNEFNKRKANPQFSDLSQWKDQDFEAITEYYWNKMEIDLDFSQPLDTRKVRLLERTPSAESPIFREMITHFDIKKDPLRSIQKGLITTEEFKLLMQRKADEYEELLRKNQKPSTFNFNQFKFLISSGVSDYETLIKQYHSLTQDAQKNGMHIVPSLCQENCQKAASSMIKKLDPSLLKKKLQNSLKELNVEDRIAMCKASFISAHVTNKKKDEFSKLWPEIKKNFDQNVFSRFSAHSRQALNKYLDQEVNFFYTDPNRTKFNDMTDQLKTVPASYASKSNQELIHQTLSLINEDTPLPQCSPSEPVFKLWDAFASKEFIKQNPLFKPEGLNPQKDNITVSPYSCEHHGEGKGIIAHEIGHAISAVISRKNLSKESSKSYLKMRKCVTDKWKDHPKTQLGYHAGDRFFTEEDTADFISYMAISDSTSFYGCALLKSDGSQYNALGVSPSQSDNHTPGMIRLLRELQYKAPQRIPPQCAEMIKRNTDKVGRSCLLK